MSVAPKDVELCPVCGLPPEYCEYGPNFDLCKPWLKENHLDLYPDLAEFEVTEEMEAATLEAISARDAITGSLGSDFVEDRRTKEEEPKDDEEREDSDILGKGSSKEKVHHYSRWSRAVWYFFRMASNTIQMLILKLPPRHLERSFRAAALRRRMRRV